MSLDFKTSSRLSAATPVSTSDKRQGSVTMKLLHSCCGRRFYAALQSQHEYDVTCVRRIAFDCICERNESEEF